MIAPQSAVEFPRRETLTVEEFAVQLGVSHRHVAKLIASGEVRSIKLGRRRLIPREVLHSLLGKPA